MTKRPILYAAALIFALFLQAVCPTGYAWEEPPSAGLEDLSALENEAARFSPEPAIVSFPAADGETCRGVIFIPAGEGPHPVILLLYGGSGESSDPLGTFKRYAPAFAASGYAVLSVGYRSGALGGPALDDVFGALDYADGHERLDRERLIIAGESEGAYLAMLAAEKTQVAGVICTGGYYDAFGILEDFRKSRKESRKEIYDETVRSLGGIVPGSGSYAARSPVYYAGNFSGAALLLHAKEDSVIPWEYSQSMADALAKASKDIEFYIYEGSRRTPDIGDESTALRISCFLKKIGMPQLCTDSSAEAEPPPDQETAPS